MRALPQLMAWGGHESVKQGMVKFPLERRDLPGPKSSQSGAEQGSRRLNAAGIREEMG